jgi:hypothetical protein
MFLGNTLTSSSRCAGLPRESGMNFGCESANLLGADDARKERSQSNSRSHGGLDADCVFDGLHLRPYTFGIVTYIDTSGARIIPQSCRCGVQVDL